MKLRPGKAAAGFTLLEIILAVGIGVVFMGGAVVFLSSTGEDPELRRARTIFETAAGVARQEALKKGREQRVILGIPEEAELMRWATLADPDRYRETDFPSDVEVNVITPADLQQGRRGWGKPEGYEWLFTGGGLVEPIRVRLRREANVEQFSFNALTGESITEKPDRTR